MLDKDFCIQKLDAAIDLVSRVSEADYPHTDSREALVDLRKVYEEDKRMLRSIPGAQQDTILEYCRHANINIVRLKKFIGMLLRSSNLRNAFEIYFPIKIYAQQILGPKAKLVLSSEWDFSPFVYPFSANELPDFIFIGIPASECQNPLIIPLSGHELGHVVWRRTRAKADFDSEITRVILEQYKRHWVKFENLFNLKINMADLENNRTARKIWGASLNLAQRQVEEVFCDYYGLHIFGLSFMYSFRYLISPSLGRFRIIEYPPIKDRALFISEAATSWGMSPTPNFEAPFSEQPLSHSNESKFILEMADETTKELRIQLRSFLDIHTGGIPRCSMASDEQSRSKNSMISLVPATRIDSIASVINASWEIRLEIDKWNILSNIEDVDIRRSQKIRVLRDLTLKSLEVYEFNKRLRKHAP